MNTYSEIKAIVSWFYDAYNCRDLEKSFEDFVAGGTVNEIMDGV